MARSTLHGTKHITEGVVQRVLEAAESLNYTRNRAARSLRTGRSQTLGLVIPDLANPYFPELAQSIGVRAREMGYALILVDSTNNAAHEARGLELLREHGVDGIILVPILDASARPQELPMVVVDRPIDGVDCIYADHYLGGRLMAEHIVELGHNRIGMVTGPLSLVSARLRRQGFLDALGGRIQLAWEFEVPFLKELSLQARTQLKHLDISLVVCGNDVIAVGVMQQLQAAGIAVPAIVSIVGFDDIPWASVVTPSLTTIAQPYGEIGERAVDILLQRLMRADGPAVNEALPVTLMQRDSAIKRVREVKR